MRLFSRIARKRGTGPSAAPAKLAKDKRGNVLAITALSLPLVIGAMGLGVDFAQWVMYKRTLQGAADGAALSAARSRAAGATDTDVESEAIKVLNANATVTRSLTDVNLLLSPGQPTGATPTSVEVIVEAPGPLYFASLFLNSSPTIRARAVAGPRGPGSACFLALGTAPSYNDEAAMEVKDATVTAPGCGFHSNSSHSAAFKDHGNGSFSGNKVSSVGGVVGISSSTPTQANAPAMTDPYGPLGRNLQRVQGTTPVVRCPGAVCPTVNGVKKMTPPGAGQCIANNSGSEFKIAESVTWDPGVYLFCGGHDTKLYLDSGTQTAAGISLVLKGGMRLYVNGNVQLNLQAMTTAQASSLYPTDAPKSALAGILFWQMDQSSPSDQPNIITGNTTAPQLLGAFYSPHTKFEIHGNLGAQGCMQLVAERVLIDGNANLTLNNNCASLTSYDSAFSHFGLSTNIVLAE